MKRWFLLGVICSIIASFLPIYSIADSVKPPIILGQSCALDGPSQNLGREMRAGLLAAFSQQNGLGGIDGREIILKSKDDGYEPYRAVKNTLDFIHKDNVFMLIGEVGTPTSKAVVPIAEKASIPFFAPLTGAQFLREEKRNYVVNIRGSYFEELERLAQYLVDKKGLTRIACFYQNDSYGYIGLEGIKKALKRRNLSLVSTGNYERNTVAVLGGLLDVNKGDPQAVVMIGAYPACTEFIKLSKLKYGKDMLYCNIYFVGSKSLMNALGEFTDGVIISQVVPFPWDRSLSIVDEYTRALLRYQSEFTPGFGSLEGYIAGKLFIEIAREVEGELTREKFLQTMYGKKKFDLGGLTLEFSPGSNQGTNTIYLTEIKNGFKKID